VGLRLFAKCQTKTLSEKNKDLSPSLVPAFVGIAENDCQTPIKAGLCFANFVLPF
jgi:hypothetical protein